MTKKLSRLIIDVADKRGIRLNKNMYSTIDLCVRHSPRMGVFMSKNTGQKKAQTESIAESFCSFFQFLINGIIWIYMFLMLVVMPFYFTQGYVSIGIDKSNFMCRWSVRLGRLLLPILVIYCILKITVYFQKHVLVDLKSLTAGKLRTIFREHFSVTDIFAALFCCSLLISYMCSDYKEQAVWGAAGWYMGLIPQLIMLMAYFLISRVWIKSKRFFLLLFPASTVVFILGYLNRFNIYPIEMEAKNAFFISTIGNTNWYCGYLVSILFAAIAMIWLGVGNKRWQKGLIVLYAFIGFAGLVTQGSASGIFTLTVVLIVMFCLSGTDGKRMQNFWQITLILSAACMLTYIVRKLFPENINFQDVFVNLLTQSVLTIIMTLLSIMALGIVFYWNKKGEYPVKASRCIVKIFVGALLTLSVIFVGLIIFNTLCPGKISVLEGREVFTFSQRWGSSRGATWMAGVMCFLEQDVLHKLVGVGPDCMSGFLYRNGSAQLLELVRSRFGTATLTNAHNEWITVLVDMGLLGAVSYIGMMISAIVRYLKAGKKNGIAGACGLCLLAYTINNIFSFQQTMNITTIFIIWGVGEAYLRSCKTSSDVSV